MNTLKFDGPKCNYFASLRQRQYINRIKAMELSNGEMTFNQDNIKDLLASHFQQFFGANDYGTNPSFKVIVIGNCLINQQQLALLKAVTAEEVKKAMLSIGSSNNLGLDGYGSEFMRVHWTYLVLMCTMLLKSSSWLVLHHMQWCLSRDSYHSN